MPLGDMTKPSVIVQNQCAAEWIDKRSVCHIRLRHIFLKSRLALCPPKPKLLLMA